MKYEIIMFDADQTLFDFKKSERAALEKTMNEFGIAYDQEYHLEIYKQINTTLWKELERGLINQKALNIERFRRLFEYIHSDIDANEFANSYIDHLSEASFLFDDTISVIQELYIHHRLIIVTNGLAKVQNRRIKKSEIWKYFETLVISEEVGVSKPNPEIFECTLRSIHRTEKSNVLVVGDSLTSDIQGGINCGLDTCWYNQNNIINTQGIIPTFEIKRLVDIQKVINDS